MNPAMRTDEVCHWVRRPGMSCWAKLGSGDLLAGREALAIILLPSQQCSVVNLRGVVVKGFFGCSG